MAYKKFQPYNEEGLQPYSLKVTSGTKFAEEHLNRTRKNPDGSMLVPPTPYRRMVARCEQMIKELDS